MDDEQHDMVSNCYTAKEMWDKLARIHEQKSELGKNVLWQKFHEAQMEPGESVMTFTTRIQKIAKQLKDLDQNVTDESMIAKILMSLPEKFAAFQSAWDSTELKRQTIENLEARLVKEENLLSRGQLPETALASNTRFHSNNSRFQSHNEVNNNQGQPDTRYCKYCKKHGHIIMKCRKRARDYKEKRHQTNHANHSNSDHHNTASFAGALVAVDEKVYANATCRKVETSDSEFKDIWVTDSGATCHMTCRRDWFNQYTETEPRHIYLGDGSVRKSKGEGTILIKRRVNGVWFDGYLENVLYVPEFNKNLYSTNASTTRGLRVTFDDNHVEIVFKQTNEVVAQGRKLDNNLCVMDFEVMLPKAEANICSLKKVHESLGHVNATRIRKMIKNHAVDGLDKVIDQDFFCEGCAYGKMHCLPHRKYEDDDDRFDIGECIYMDLCGPMSVSLGGSKYFMLAKDRKSSYLFVYFLKRKNEAFPLFEGLYNYIATYLKTAIKMVRTDDGLEFCNNLMHSFLRA